MNLTAEEYHADPCEKPSLSRSIIHTIITKTPRHAWLEHPRLNPNYAPKEKAEFDLGSAAHALLLEGKDRCAVIDADDWRKKETKELREEARAQGKHPLLRKTYEEALAMVDSAKEQIRACPDIDVTDFITDGLAEQTYTWIEDMPPFGETYFRIRPDWVSHDRALIIDYKTTAQSANPDDFQRSIVSMGLDIQAALYPRGIAHKENINPPKFVFMVQETEYPYLCSFIGLQPMFLDMGRQKIEYGAYLWNQCLSTNHWPAYPNRIAYVDPPAWALAQWEQIAERIG